MDYDKMMAAHSIEVQEENGKLKSKIRELERENYELKAENKRLKEKLEQKEKYQQNNWIKLKKVQGENYKLKKNIEMIRKAFPMFFDEGQQIGEPYGKSILQLIKSGEPPATLADMERYGNKINK